MEGSLSGVELARVLVGARRPAAGDGSHERLLRRTGTGSDYQYVDLASGPFNDGYVQIPGAVVDYAHSCQGEQTCSVAVFFPNSVSTTTPGVWTSTVPEPGVGELIASAVLALAAARRRFC